MFKRFLRRYLGITQLESKVHHMFQELAQLEAQINAQTVLVTQVVDAINKLKSQPPVAITPEQLAAIDAATAALASNNAALTAVIA
jgi:hypothetical protein